MFRVVKETKCLARDKWLYLLSYNKMKKGYEALTIIYEEFS